MSNAALAYAPGAYNTAAMSPAALRILRRSTTDTCPTHKHAYRTERKARIALEAIQRAELRRQTVLRQTDRVERKPYRCRHCGLHHLTSQP